MKHLKRLYRWLVSFDETGEICPQCGGRIVERIGWAQTWRFCPDCRHDMPDTGEKK